MNTHEHKSDSLKSLDTTVDSEIFSKAKSLSLLG